MTDAPARPRRKLLLGALVIGLLGLGAAALYGTGGGAGNAVAAECRASQQAAKRIAPLARGEVAALSVPETPKPAPAVTFNDPAGQPLTLDAFKGRTVLVNLWATWCAPCRHEMPALDKLQAELGGRDFEVVAVNIDTRNPDRAATWLTENGIRHMANYSDSSARIFQDLKAAGRAFGMPTTLLIDANGCELGFLAGPAEWASEDAMRLIRTALGT